jgi:hypothetical protein
MANTKALWQELKEPVIYRLLMGLGIIALSIGAMFLIGFGAEMLPNPNLALFTGWILGIPVTIAAGFGAWLFANGLIDTLYILFTGESPC